jgi:hypothetical protein
MIGYKPKFEYSAEEWATHFEHFFRSPNGSNRHELMRYFHSQYPSPQTPSEGCWKMNRCGTALAYLMRHLADFEKFVVVLGRKGLVSFPIVLALWRYYGAIPDEYLKVEPAPELILGLVED